jgi:hypothetical protein
MLGPDPGGVIGNRPGCRYGKAIGKAVNGTRQGMINVHFMGVVYIAFNRLKMNLQLVDKLLIYKIIVFVSIFTGTRLGTHKTGAYVLLNDIK